MKPMHWTLAAATALAMWSIVATAQQERPQASPAARDAQAPTQMMAAERGEMDRIGVQRGADQIIGMRVHNTAGQTLGKVQDIILDDQQGRITFATVSTGGILGIGAKQYAVPWQAFSLEDDQLGLNVSKDRMKSAPRIPKGKLPERKDAKFYQHLRAFYQTPSVGMNAAAETQSSAGADAKSASSPAKPNQDVAGRATKVEGDAGTQGPDWKFWSARDMPSDWSRRVSDLIGIPVDDAHGNNLGDIDDLVIDMSEGRVSYALVRFGGEQSQTAAVPWAAMALNRQRDVYTLDATIDQLELALMTDEEVGKLQDEMFSRTICGAFGVEPYWAAYGEGPVHKNATGTSKSVKTAATIAPHRERHVVAPAKDVHAHRSAPKPAKFARSAKAGDAHRVAPSSSGEVAASVNTSSIDTSLESAKESVTLEGTVEKTHTYLPIANGLMNHAGGRSDQPSAAANTEEGLRAILRTDSGADEVLLFPSSKALDDQDVDLTKAGKVEITGYRTESPNEKVIAVKTLKVDGEPVRLKPSKSWWHRLGL